VLRMGDRVQDTGDRGELLDIRGRKIMELTSGANDVSRLASGVYFVREPSAVNHEKSAVAKVIIQR